MAALAKHAGFVWGNFANWLGIDLNRHLSWLVTNLIVLPSL
jgi:hypothetical protein